MEKNIVVAQQLDLSGATGFQPSTFTLARDPNPTFWEKLAHGPTPLILAGILAVVGVGIVIYVRKTKSA